MKAFLLAAAATLTLTAAPALAAGGDMSVAVFLAKVEALKAKGAMALFSSDVGTLKQEGRAAGQAYRARLQGERAAGKPSSCPPKGTKVTSDQLIAHLRSYPEPARARTNMRTAMADLFIKTWPCK